MGRQKKSIICNFVMWRKEGIIGNDTDFLPTYPIGFFLIGYYWLFLYKSYFIVFVQINNLIIKNIIYEQKNKKYVISNYFK